MGEKRRGIGFETVAGMGGGYRRNTPRRVMGGPLLFPGGSSVACLFLFAVCSVISVFLPQFFNHTRFERQEELSIEYESDWDARARWMKSSFPRLSWPWIISVFASVGGTVPRCPLCLIIISSYRTSWR